MQGVGLETLLGNGAVCGFAHVISNALSLVPSKGMGEGEGLNLYKCGSVI